MRRIALLAALVAACGSSPKKERETAKSEAGASRESEEFTDKRPVPKPPTPEEVRDFERIWTLYDKDDPRWPLERDRFKQRSDSAAYLLTAFLMRYYMQLNTVRDRAGEKLVRVKEEIVEVGETAAPALVDMMILDRIPMKDGRYFLTDDLTRKDCLDMLERMGAQAVPHLLQALERKDLGEKGRRHLALALGGTGDKRVYETLVRLLREDPSWQVRADAATGLAKLGDRRALAPLHEAVLKDEDKTVVRRAGKARYDLTKGRPR
ncbi:MAG: HEAT repeat domain-containing protein [Planctomycetota bacterium]|jgi:hypothetical protein